MGGRPPLPPGVADWLKALISVLAIGAFSVLFVDAIYQVWKATAGNPPAVDPAKLYVATLLASMVGGFFAVALGLTPPPNTSGGGRLSLATNRISRLDLGGGLLGGLDTRGIIAIVYAFAYLLISAAACFTWLSHSAETSDLVKSLATTFIGLMIGTATNYVRG